MKYMKTHWLKAYVASRTFFRKKKGLHDKTIHNLPQSLNDFEGVPHTIPGNSGKAVLKIGNRRLLIYADASVVDSRK